MKRSSKKSLLMVLALVVMFALVGQARAVDIDGDGVDDANDLCIGEPNFPVNLQGCIDTDLDGITDANDLLCPDSDPGVSVDTEGCELDSDNDGVADSNDLCSETRRLSTVNTDGCLDPDGDGVYDPCDVCRVRRRVTRLIRTVVRTMTATVFMATLTIAPTIVIPARKTSLMATAPVTSATSVRKQTRCGTSALRAVRTGTKMGFRTIRTGAGRRTREYLWALKVVARRGGLRWK